MSDDTSLKSRRQIATKKGIIWITSNLDKFGISSDQLDSDELKKLAELAILCELYKRRFGVCSEIEDFISYIVNTLKLSKYSEKIVRSPELLLLHANLYSVLHEFGLEIDGLTTSLQKITEKYATSIEFVPFRKMDLAYSLNKGRLIHRLPNLSSLYEETLLSKDLSLLLLSVDDVYALTHTIFYLSDFGSRNISEFSRSEVSNIHSIIGALLCIYLKEKDLDVLAELLFCCHCLRWFPSSVYWISWDNLLNAQNSDGSFNGPYPDKETKHLNEKALEEYNFQKNYHTTLVSVCACFSDLGGEVMYNSNHLHTFESKFSIRKSRSALTKAHKWMKNIYDDMSGDKIAVSPLLQILVGEWICYRLTARYDSDILAVAKSIRQRIDNLDFSSLIECDTNLIFLGTGILRELDLESNLCEKFSQKAAEALNYHIKNKNDLKYFRSRFLLHRLGLTKKTDLREININGIAGKSSNLYITDEHLDEFIRYTELLTLFGHRKTDLERFSFDISTAMIASLLFSFYKYDLDRGMQLMRNMNYLRLSNCQSFNDGMEFMILQQHDDGKFGFFPSEIMKWKEINPKFDEKIHLYLPHTVSALWTIAEGVDNSFSLFHSIGST